MKIWWQSAMNLGFNPVWDDYAESLKTYLGQVARNDTEVAVRGIEAFTPLGAKSYYAELLVKPLIVKAAIRAEQEGYDVFCLGSGREPGYREIKEVVRIPVCSIVETSMYLASLLGGKFAILNFSKAMLVKLTELAHYYGLQDKLVSTSPLVMDVTSLQQGFTNPRILLEPAKEIAREAAQNGASILITGAGEINMMLRKHGITEISGVPVLEGNGATIKMAELMVNLEKIGIKRSQLAFPPVTKDELADIQKTFSGISLT